jgi:23S rRNA (pseudouridine1915-N3)-methyltransferase
MKLTVLAVGRLRPPYADDVQHYATLLKRHAKLELVEVREDEQAGRRIAEGAYVCALHSEGRTYDSAAFARWVEERRHGGRDVVFVIGGPFGLPELGRPADHTLSLGPMTLPHQLARVVLLEQLYRAHKILANEPYHY